MDLVPANWSAIFALETPLLELVLRAVVLYLGILFLLRVMPRRAAGELTPMDLVMILMITESASHALGEYSSVGEGLLQIAVVGSLAWAVNALSFHVPLVARLVEAPPLKIIRDGKLLRRNLRREYITEEELQAAMRENGISDVSQVREAHVEGEGRISFVKKKDA